MIHFLLLALFLFTIACTEPETMLQEPQTPAPTPVDCQTRCAAKAMMCGATSEQAALACSQDYCTGQPTQDYVSCLESSPCAIVGEPEDARAVCGSDPGPVSSGCDGYPRCVGNSIETCSMSGGAKVLETIVCSANQTCSDGVCEQNACIMSGRTGCNSGNNPSNCCDDRQSCFSNGNLSGETICCVPMNSECSSDSDCCNNDNPNVPVTCRLNKCGIL